MMMWLAVVRFVHFAASLLIVSVWWVDLALMTPGVRRDCARLGGDWDWRARVIFFTAWPAAVISGGMWFWLVAAEMSGVPALRVMGSGNLLVVWGQTEFGAVWKWRCVIGAAAILFGVAALVVRGGPVRRRVLAGLAGVASGGFLGGLAWAGHGLISPRLHLPMDVVHLLAASFWPAGLVPFLILLKRVRKYPGREGAEAVGRLTVRFSAISLLCVAALLGTGIANSIFLLGSPGDLWGTIYGGVLLAKIVLFVLAAGIGARNLLFLKPRMAAAGGDERAAGMLARDVAAEIVLAAIILAPQGVMGLQAPPRG